MKEELLKKIEEYHQEHVLSYYDALDEAGKARLTEQLGRVDFTLLDLLKDGEHKAERGVITPIDAISIDDIEKKREIYTAKGLDAIRQGKVAAMLLAGGQGTRLGCSGPKGRFNIGVTHDLFIFEQLFRNTMDIVEQAGAWIPFFIMTSDKNHEETVEFLTAHDFFGYKKELVFFFRQEMAPSADYDHKLLLEAPDRLAMSPNGNGGWFTSFANAGLLKKAKELGVEWLNCFAVDNVLQRICDPCFVGAVLEGGCDSGAKVVSKADPEEHVGVLCLEDGHPSIIEYYECTHEMNYAKDENGDYLYRFGVILNYLFRMDKLEAIMNDRMPVHVVEKKIPYVDVDGTEHKPEKPNGYKFETLILDMVHKMDKCLAYEVVRDREFAPVKNKEGVDSVVSARELLKKNGVEL